MISSTILLLLSCSMMITCYAQIVDTADIPSADPENSELCPLKPPDFNAPWPSCDETALTEDCNYSPGPCMLDPNETCYNIFCSCMNSELVCAVPSGGGGGGQVPPPEETEAPITMAPVTNSPISDYTRPINDICEDATEILTLPFQEEGSVTNATFDNWTIPEGEGFTQVGPGNGVWYVLSGFEPGVKVSATFIGMDAMLLQNKNCTLDAFSRVDGTISKTNDELTYEWTIGDDREISYFLYIAPTMNIPGPDYTMNVENVTFTMAPTMAPTIIDDVPINQPTSSASLNRRNVISQAKLGIFVSTLFFISKIVFE